MSATDDIRAREIARADQVLREVCDDFLASLADAASRTAAEPSWCIDAFSIRRLLAEERSPNRGESG